MKQIPADIWFMAAGKTKKASSSLEDFSSWQQEMLLILQKKSPELFSGEKVQTDRREELIGKLTKLAGQGTHSTYRDKLLFLAKGIAFGNHIHNWALPLNPILIRINREKNYISPDRFTARPAIESLVQEFLKDLENETPACLDTLTAQILLSAVLFGGLLTGKWLPSFLKALTDHSYYQHGSWLWMEMELDSSIKRAKFDELPSLPRECRRWVADPLTQLLIYRYHSSAIQLNKQRKKSWSLLSAYLNTLPIPEEHRPKTQSELLQWAMERYTDILPGNLLAYARNDISSTSLTVEAWLRAFTDLQIPVKRQKRKIEQSLKRRQQRILVSSDAQNDKQLSLFKELLDMLNPHQLDKQLKKHQARKCIRDFLKEHEGQLSCSNQLLARWAIQLMSKRISPLEGRKPSPLAPSSAFRYLNEIGTDILTICEMHDIRLFSPLDLETIYEQANLKKSCRLYNLKRLEHFHGYLRVFYDVTPLDFSVFTDDNLTHTANVDANIITPKIYQSVLTALGWGQDKIDRWQKIHLIATILAYRLALRPSEIQALRLEDVRISPKPEVLIRNTLFNSLKTNAAIRRIPLSSFLSYDELKLIEGFVSERKQERTHWDNEIFLHHPVRKAGMLSNEEIFDEPRHALRIHTQDERIRFYSLRHSALSNLALLLQLRSDIPYEGIALLKHADFCFDRREALKKSLFANENCGRKYQYAMALLAGHNSPKTTYKHYLHLTDWLLGYHLRHPANSPACSYKGLMNICGLSKAAVFAQLPAENERNKTHILQKLVDSRASKYSSALQSPLLQQAKKTQSPKTKQQKPNLPPWDEALSIFTTDIKGSPAEAPHIKLPNKNDWLLAEKIYSTLAGQPKKSIPKLVRICQDLLRPYPNRWGGFEFSNLAHARTVAGLFEQCGISKKHWLVKHHPRRGQDIITVESYLTSWQKAFNDAAVISGEESNKNDEGVPKRGLATLIIASSEITEERLNSARRPSMSHGVIFGLQLFFKVATD